jgi:hypothetical protein
MRAEQTLTAIKKREQNTTVLTRFDLRTLRRRLPLVFPRDPVLLPSPKRRYRSHYRYQGSAQGRIWRCCRPSPPLR